MKVLTRPKLNLRTRDFIRHYTDPDGGTYGNGRQSALKAGYGNGDPTQAEVYASKLLRTDKVMNEVDAILESRGAGIQVRLELLADIAMGKRQTETKTLTTSLDGKGNITETEATVTHDTTNQDVIKGNEILNRMNGHYEKTKAVGDAMSSELKQIMRDQRAKFREV